MWLKSWIRPLGKRLFPWLAAGACLALLVVNLLHDSLFHGRVLEASLSPSPSPSRQETPRSLGGDGRADGDPDRGEAEGRGPPGGAGTAGGAAERGRRVGADRGHPRPPDRRPARGRGGRARGPRRARAGGQEGRAAGHPRQRRRGDGTARRPRPAARPDQRQDRGGLEEDHRRQRRRAHRLAPQGDVRRDPREAVRRPAARVEPRGAAPGVFRVRDRRARGGEAEGPAPPEDRGRAPGVPRPPRPRRGPGQVRVRARAGPLRRRAADAPGRRPGPARRGRRHRRGATAPHPRGRRGRRRAGRPPRGLLRAAGRDRRAHGLHDRRPLRRHDHRQGPLGRHQPAGRGRRHAADPGRPVDRPRRGAGPRVGPRHAPRR